MTWGIDGFGNQTSQNLTGSPSVTVPSPRTATYSPTNQIATSSLGTVTYDAAGNVTGDGINTYKYDPEDRLTTTNNTTGNTFNALGQRIGSTTGYGWVFDLEGHQIAQLTNGGKLNQGQIYVGDEVIAENAFNTTYLRLTDQVGSLRGLGDVTGNWVQKCLSLPYGDGSVCAGGGSPLFFADKPRDNTNGNDVFGARYYESRMGSFLSADWSAQIEPVPYAKLGDPESLNLYGYVMNNPTTSADADGHDGGPCVENGQGGSSCAPFAAGSIVSGGDPEDTALRATRDSQLADPPLVVPHAPGNEVHVYGGAGQILAAFEDFIYHRPYISYVVAPSKPAPTTSTVIKQKLIRLACSTSPQNKVLAAARFGFVNGAVRGVIAGATGGAFFEGVGAIPGAIIGGFVGGVAGTAGGIITGGATAGVCSIAGVY